MSRLRVAPALSLFHEKLLTAFAYTQGTSKAEIVKRGIANVIGAMDEKQRDQLLKLYERMSPEERKNPGR